MTTELFPFKDNTIFSDTAAVNELSNGAGNFIFAGNTRDGTDVTRRALMAFDLSGIPAGATITDASLRLRATREAPNTVDADFTLHRLVADWGEGGSIAGGQEGRGTSALAGDATWRHTFFDQAFWAVTGGDFVASPSATQHIDGLGFHTFTGPGFIADTQYLLDHPAENFGWILRGDETRVFTALQFGSRNDTDIGPLLRVTYNVIPEPGAWALCIVGGIGLCFRAFLRKHRAA